jgi:hypothetical protein
MVIFKFPPLRPLVIRLLYTLVRTLGGPQNRSGLSGEKVKRQERESDHSLPSIAKDNNGAPIPLLFYKSS